MMGIPTPEQQAAMKAAKEAKKAAKKAKYGAVNEDKNIPVCEMLIPWAWVDEASNGSIAGKEIDLEKHPDWLDSLEEAFRNNPVHHGGQRYEGPLRRKIVRT